MKKLFLSLVAVMGVCALSAQNLTETFNSAVSALQSKDYAAAATAFEQVIDAGMLSEDTNEVNLAATAQQQLPNCYFRMGQAAAQQKNYDLALTHTQKALDLSVLYGVTKTENNAKRMLGMIYQAQGGEAFNSKDWATAAAIFEKGHEADPRNAQMANWLATCYCEMGEYTKGLGMLTKMAGSQNPKYEAQANEAKELLKMYTNNMVAGYQQNNDFDGMLAAAEALLAMDAQHPVALKVRVQAYDGKKDYAKVIELAEAAALAQSDVEDASYLYYLQGVAYNAKEMKAEAIAALKKVTAGASVEAAQAAIADLSK